MANMAEGLMATSVHAGANARPTRVEDGGALLSAMRVSPNDGVEEVADGVGGTGLRQQLRTEARDLVRVPSGAGMRLDRVLQQAGKRGLEARNVIEGMGHPSIDSGSTSPVAAAYRQPPCRMNAP